MQAFSFQWTPYFPYTIPFWKLQTIIRACLLLMAHRYNRLPHWPIKNFGRKKGQTSCAAMTKCQSFALLECLQFSCWGKDKSCYKYGMVCVFAFYLLGVFFFFFNEFKVPMDTLNNTRMFYWLACISTFQSFFLSN